VLLLLVLRMLEVVIEELVVIVGGRFKSFKSPNFFLGKRDRLQCETMNFLTLSTAARTFYLKRNNEHFSGARWCC
jgi:hypothetical protein